MDKSSHRRRRFSKRVDKRSRAEMIQYLSQHSRYHTMNSWNNCTSYACNMKIHNLLLSGCMVEKFYDLIQVPEFYDQLNELIEDFNRRHSYLWQAGWNGRSGGYLVLYQGMTEPSGYRSYCTNCGQKNYKSVAESGARCGVCGEETRIDYQIPPVRVVTLVGRAIDKDPCFEEWTIEELRERTELIQDFDQLADDIVEKALYIADTCSVEEQIVYVPTTERVLVQEAVG